LTIVDDTSTVTCVDSICIISGAAQAFICCNQVICGGCATLMIDLLGAAPWTIIISDGHLLDTISGIVNSPYSHIVCPVGDTTMNYKLIEVTGFEDQCPGEIIGDSVVTIEFNSSPVPIISQLDTMLCAPIEMISYCWYECDRSQILSSSQCFTPPAPGCYCVDVISIEGCMATACTDIIDGIQSPKTGFDISIFPNPTNGQLQVHLSDDISLPVNWVLFDPKGFQFGNGIIYDKSAQLKFRNELPTGLYFIQFKSKNEQVRIVKIIIE